MESVSLIDVLIFFALWGLGWKKVADALRNHKKKGRRR